MLVDSNFQPCSLCHLHLDDWALVCTALESLVIDLEKSEGRMYGNMLERAEGLRNNIKTVILESDEPII